MPAKISCKISALQERIFFVIISENILSTVGINKVDTKFKLNDGKEIKLIIWDTAGQERFHSIAITSVKNSQGIILVYDITNRKSFEDLNMWINDINNATDKASIILFGNKCDLQNRQVSKEEGMRYKNDQGLDLFMETSAKTGYNARNVLIEAAKILYADYLKYIENNPQGENVPGQTKKNTLKKEEEKKKRKCC